jgi:probable HAF family extracellular repeat protein
MKPPSLSALPKTYRPLTAARLLLGGLLGLSIVHCKSDDSSSEGDTNSSGKHNHGHTAGTENEAGSPTADASKQASHSSEEADAGSTSRDGNESAESSSPDTSDSEDSGTTSDAVEPEAGAPTPSSEPKPDVPSAIPEYDIVDLGVVDGDTQSEGFAINIDGDVMVNGVLSTGVYHDKSLTDIGLLPDGTKIFGEGMNDSGDVVGKAWLADVYAHAFLYRDGALTNLAAEVGETLVSEVKDINNQGVMLLYVDGAYFRYEDGEKTPLPQDPMLGGMTPVALNDEGVIVGTQSFGSLTDLHTDAAKLEGDMVTDLGDLEGNGSQGMAINNHGDVVGLAFTASNDQHAVLFKDGEVTDLGVLEGHMHSHALGINDDGVIVGESISFSGGGDKAFVYADGVMVDLNERIAADSGWILTRANAINNAGQITGVGSPDGTPIAHAFRATPK